MKRFVERFCQDEYSLPLEERINNYAEIYNLKIITISASKENEMYVLFEESEDTE